MYRNSSTKKNACLCQALKTNFMKKVIATVAAFLLVGSLTMNAQQEPAKKEGEKKEHKEGEKKANDHKSEHKSEHKGEKKGEGKKEETPKK
jgi:Ni/Co efflux regulator RcnB